jgi:hypothetical protein
MKFVAQHRNLTLACAFLCVLGGAFGFGDESDQRIFRSRTRSARGGAHRQCHQVLDSIHDDVLAHFANETPGSGGNGDSGSHFWDVESPIAFALYEGEPKFLVPANGVLRRLPPGVRRNAGRAPPFFFLPFA